MNFVGHSFIRFLIILYLLFCCVLINNVQLLERRLLSLLLLWKREVTQEIITGIIPLKDAPHTELTFVRQLLGVPTNRAHLYAYPGSSPSWDISLSSLISFQSKEITARHHHGLAAALAVPSQDLSILMEEAEASLTGDSFSDCFLIQQFSLVLFCVITSIPFPLTRKATTWQSTK